jgi:hypothetical protein
VKDLRLEGEDSSFLDIASPNSESFGNIIVITFSVISRNSCWSKSAKTSGDDETIHVYEKKFSTDLFCSAISLDKFFWIDILSIAQSLTRR